MNGLRSLLRLEDKVAAEGRRLRDLGGPSMRWVAPAVLTVAVTLHGAILLLPAVRTRPTLPAASPMPDFPLVWRPGPAPSAPQLPALSPAPSLAPDPSASRPSNEARAATQAAGPTPVRTDLAVPSRAARQPPAATVVTRRPMIEPVPEPLPELAINTMSADVEDILANPSAPPPSLDLGPPSGVVPTSPSDAAPNALERVSPVYPVAARSLRAEGRVKLRLTVLSDGSVGKATVEECSRTGLGFEAAALAAVKRWRYEPTPLQSSPRKVIVTVHFQRQEGRP